MVEGSTPSRPTTVTGSARGVDLTETDVRNLSNLIVTAGLALALSACGHNTEQRAATGAAAGAVVAGPVGAVVGAGAGVVISKVTKDH